MFAKVPSAAFALAAARHASSSQLLARLPASARRFSELREAQSFADPSASAPPPAPPAAEAAMLAAQTQPRLAYAIARNSNGSLPVYTDIRAAGAKTEILVRNVEGSADALARDLKASLFPADSPEASRLKTRVVRSRHVVLEGGNGRWKHHVMAWMQKRGF